MNMRLLRSVTALAMVLSLLVVMLGAYTRLTDAGLGCPDWPGCYGQMTVPSGQGDIARAETRFPNVPVEGQKAWTEMVHRYAAGTLALLLSIICLTSFYSRCLSRSAKITSLLLILLVVFQALLGMWTVTLKLLPVVVLGHLLGGMGIFASLCGLNWQLSSIKPLHLKQWRPWFALGAVLVFCQIALGGLVSSNYAGIACIGFPKCNGAWLPGLDFLHSLNLFSSIGLNHQGGLLDNPARVTLQFLHRIGALVTATYLILLAIRIIRSPEKKMQAIALSMLILLGIQFTLGVLNVLYFLPLSIAVAHNGCAALLLGLMISAYYLMGNQAKERVYGRSY